MGGPIPRRKFSQSDGVQLLFALAADWVSAASSTVVVYSGRYISSKPSIDLIVHGTVLIEITELPNKPKIQSIGVFDKHSSGSDRIVVIDVLGRDYTWLGAEFIVAPGNIARVARHMALSRRPSWAQIGYG